MTTARKPDPDNIFDLSFRGGLPDMLRAIAAKIESREVKAEQFTCTVTEEYFDLATRIMIHPKP